MKRPVLALLAATLLLLTVPSLASAGAISGKVFYHPPSGPDVPIPNVGIAVKTVTDAPVTTTATAADGTYSASVFGAASGTTYHVYVSNLWQFISPAGGEIDAVVTGSATTANVNFSVKGVSFVGTIFNDLDGDAVHDAGETAGVAGATLSVTGGATTQATTDAFGGFSTVPILPAGQYTLTPSKSGYVATSTPIKTGIAGQQVNAGYVGLHFPTGTVQGRAYVETNGTAGKQADERPISGAGVTVTGTADGQPFSFSGTTDQDGNFQITAYAGANRVVSVAQPSAYADGPDFTSVAGAVSGPDKFTFALGENTTAGPFEFGETGATISGVAFRDRDGDGVRDPDEQPFPDRVIDLTGTLGFAATATSGQDGVWTVAGVPAGNLTVASQSVTDSLAPAPLSLSPTPGQVLADLDLAYRLASINGSVVDRTTGRGVAGVTVKLAGPATATTVTAADGSFHFYDLLAGIYAVSATVPTGYSPATSAAGSLGGSAGSASVAGIPVAAGDAGTSYVLRVAAPLNGGGGTEPGGSGGTKVTVVAGSRLKVRKRAFKLGCRLDAGALRSCAFIVRDSKRKVIAKGTARTTSGGLRLTATVRLTKLGRTLRGKRVRVTASVVATDARGKRLRASRRLRLALR
jgi:large repetitive protein